MGGDERVEEALDCGVVVGGDGLGIGAGGFPGGGEVANGDLHAAQSRRGVCSGRMRPVLLSLVLLVLAGCGPEEEGPTPIERFHRRIQAPTPEPEPIPEQPAPVEVDADDTITVTFERADDGGWQLHASAGEATRVFEGTRVEDALGRWIKEQRQATGRERVHLLAGRDAPWSDVVRITNALAGVDVTKVSVEVKKE